MRLDQCGPGLERSLDPICEQRGSGKLPQCKRQSLCFLRRFPSLGGKFPVEKLLTPTFNTKRQDPSDCTAEHAWKFWFYLLTPR